MKDFLVYILILFNTTCFATYHSQYGQDRFAWEHYFQGLSSGVFVDIGAHDGIFLSNSYFFENEQNWTGICVEPIPEVFTKLQKNRKCICINGCVSNSSGEGLLLWVSGPIDMLTGLVDKYDPRHLERIQNEIKLYGGKYSLINVRCYTLNELLDQSGITHVNFLSIDTEGGEFDIISTIDYSRFEIDVITVEDNYGDHRFIPFLNEKGFNFVGYIACDLTFVRRDFKPFH